MSTNVTVSGVASANVRTLNSAKRGDWYRVELRGPDGKLIGELDVFGEGIDAWSAVKWTFDDEALNHRPAPASDRRLAWFDEETAL